MHRAKFTDVTIVGGGPAGLSAAVHAASEGLHVTVLDSEPQAGGQAKFSSRIENYLGYPGGLSGHHLMNRAKNQAEKFNAKFLFSEPVVEMGLEGKLKIVRTANGHVILSRSVIVASGLQWRSLNAPGCSEYAGKGVFYGANPQDGPDAAGKHVHVVGGANSAGQAAFNFSHYADKVTMLVRGQGLTGSMSQYLSDRISKTHNIEVLAHTEVVGVAGDGAFMQTIELVTGDHRRTEMSDGLYIFIGAEPRTLWLKGVCKLDKRGFVVTDAYYRTSCPGVFAAGDVRKDSVKRMASAVGEGAGAVASLHAYLMRNTL